MFPYLTLADETEIVHSHILEEDGVRRVEVHFERPTEQGFCSARCVLPEYRWKFNDGFSKEELAFFQELLEHNAHLLYRYAAEGGMRFA